MKNKLLNPISMFVIGGVLGILSKYLDIHTSLLGNVFSEFSVWILFGVLISIYSDTKKEAMINVFTFCIGMLITYYISAKYASAFYGFTFVRGWTIFSFFTPVFAYFTWMTKEKGIFPKIISIGIVLVSSFLSFFLFSIDIFDLIINVILIYFLFFKKIDRGGKK